MERNLRKLRMTPAQTITLSFALLILAGGVLLNLPVASRSGQSIGFLDALFTSTSAVCVTGLVVVNTLKHWTPFGKVVILALIQCGALGFMTLLTVGMMALRRQISLKDRMVIQASFNQAHTGGMVRLVRRIIFFTLAIEGVGALLLALSFFFTDGLPLLDALGKGVFHSVSAFCNAGFDIVGDSSLTPYRANLPINAVIMGLIVLGGLGFTVLGEVHGVVKNKAKRPLRLRLHHMSLHSKIALAITAWLILSGTLLLLLLAWANPQTLAGLPLGEKLLASLFQSVTLRTAGFNTIDQKGLTEASQFVSCIYMLIGGSPSGTAGGMKTVTLGVILAAMVSVFRGRRQIEAYGRTLPLDMLQKALTVACAILAVVTLSTILLYFAEQNAAYPHSFMDLLFETSSATATVGVSTGITSQLSPWGKGILILCMFLGRLGPVTVVLALNTKLHAEDDGTVYPEERVIIG